MWGIGEQDGDDRCCGRDAPAWKTWLITWTGLMLIGTAALDEIIVGIVSNISEVTACTTQGEARGYRNWVRGAKTLSEDMCGQYRGRQ